MARQYVRQADATSQTVRVRAYVASTGLPKTGLAYNTAGLVAYYIRSASSASAITLATQTAAGAFSSGGFVEISSANAPGEYRLDIPNAALATGVKDVSVILSGVSDVVFEPIHLDLVAYDPHAAGADSATIADAVWDEARADHVAAGSFGEYVKADTIAVSGDSVAADNLEAALDATGGVTISAVLGANAITASSIASNAITSAKIAADAIGATQIAADAITAAKIATGAITAAKFAAGAIDAAAIAADAIDEIWDEVVEGTTTARQSLRLGNAALGGKASGMSTTTATIRDVGDTKNRIVATVDADGNRSAVTLDLT